MTFIVKFSAGGERGILNPALWLPPSATFSLVGLTNRHFVQDETGKIDWFFCVPAHTRKKNSTANAVLFFLWEDYKKDFLAFLGWYLYPYKKS